MLKKQPILSVENIRKTILVMAKKHRDDKTIDQIVPLMKKNKGSEEKLLKAMCSKYKEKNPGTKPEKLKDTYSIGSKLGTGGFAIVRKCQRKKDKAIFALKIINKKKLDQKDFVILESEVNIMREISHDNIVTLYDVFESKKRLCLVLDNLGGGELFDRIVENGSFSEKDAANSFAQMVAALSYLHDNDIVHRDLKPENLLFESKKANSPIKLIDFGLAGRCTNKDLKTPCGTPNYVAPEILQRKPYGKPVDMWSAGVILYIILCGFPPFYDENDDLSRLYRKIKKASYDMPSPYWDNISKGAKDIVKKLLVTDPKKRLTAKKTLKHYWLKEASDKALSPEARFHLKRFQHIRKLRRGVRCILAVLRLIKALGVDDPLKGRKMKK